MADNPLSIRTSEGVKALFNELAETGEFENKGEFLQRLLIQYQLEAAKNDVSVMKPAIEAAETLSARLLEILNGTAAAILTKNEEGKKELEDTKVQMQGRIAELEQERNEDAERIQLLSAELTELHGEIKRLENAVADKNALIKAHKHNSDTQSKLTNLLNLLEAQVDKPMDALH